ncbi:hypothetical protein C3747_147g83 [Trypanosoma cruzi]|uniref:PH domain-containing protein n=2 Tax=Trypanosoma cruzi TaxID=5693 RepID=Q4DX23_TRYCC|nr:hypothetical protein Tc00.1047053508831.63 [Trypanosoma cruzi]EAN97079.1 hypothetical protein Tc00.1047053508831.63 [Trypanosoma cruzi]PWV04615.1 hypothetical protein C3747_147g83 [Trypanosoma cruzi]|eukprot:XP_818930.1 hypothetical protein [Trypanosoma cruzi strain CL Brener]
MVIILCFFCFYKRGELRMASLESSFRLGCSDPETTPSSPLRLIGGQQRGSVESSMLFLQLRDLRAHAAVRVIETGNYKDQEPSTPYSSPKKPQKFSLGRSFRSVTSCLASKVMIPSPEERYVAIEQTSAHTAAFVVRYPQRRERAGGAAEEIGDVILSFPLTKLVDVSTFFLHEKGFFTFNTQPGAFDPCHAAENTVRTKKKGSNGAMLSSSSSSSSFSPNGDVGLQLVFKEPHVSSPPAKDNFRKVEMQFASSRERDVWLHCLEEFYASFLLDSVRTGSGVCLTASEMRGLIEESTRLMQQKPAPAVIERYIDFFLFSSCPEEADRKQEVRNINPKDVPCGGIIRIDLGDNQFETRRFAYKKITNRSHLTKGNLEDEEEEEYLVICPTTVSQHVRRIRKQKVPTRKLRVVVEEEDFGNTFFLEQTTEATEAHRDSILSVCQSKSCKFHSGVVVSAPRGNSDFAITETIELHTSGFSERNRWLRWFELVLGKPVIYLSRLREEKKTLEMILNPRQRASSLCLEYSSPSFTGDG